MQEYKTEKVEELKEENKLLKEENKELKKEIYNLKNKIENNKTQENLRKEKLRQIFSGVYYPFI